MVMIVGKVTLTFVKNTAKGRHSRKRPQQIGFTFPNQLCTCKNFKCIQEDAEFTMNNIVLTGILVSEQNNLWHCEQTPESDHRNT